MDKTRIKSILPKPSPAISTATPSPKMVSTPTGGNKRRSIPTNNVNEFNVSKRSRSKSANPVATANMDDDSIKSEDRPVKQTGHRPVTSCTFCRQHKIKCNASDNYPNPCQRCDRMGLKCEIDPQFRPKKGSQIQSLKSDVDELKSKIEMLTKNETLLTQALNQHNVNFMQRQSQQASSPYANSWPVSTQSSHGQNTPVNLPVDNSPQTFQSNFSPVNTYDNYLNDSIPNNSSNSTQISHILQENSDNSPATTHTPKAREEIEYRVISEFILGDVRLPLEKADELHERFMIKHLPFLPILSSRSATELYYKSQLLFWVVMLTASLSEPEPTLYMSLASLIKQLAIETCWIRTPRSTHVIQALIILSIWPLPNEKVLDDCSYRFIGLAKNLSLQLGLHRGGDFIQEFSRTQVNLGPDAECWRTRTWLSVFLCEQFWSSVLGLPPSINTTDYLIENARVDDSLPKSFRCLISLSIFQCKLVNVMGISVTRSDGLLDPQNRAGSLNILDRELERLKFKLPIEKNSAVEIYYLYIKLMLCCFAFLPGTPIEDQVKYVSSAYLSATRIITISSQMVNTISLIELPIYVRQAITYSVLLLFKLHLSRYLIDKYVDSARQSIVTVHRLLRNTLSSWKDLQNDISRTAKVLENLNIVLYTYPEVFLSDNEAGGSIITRMRSHLTASLFYDLVWCVHEARRRTLVDKSSDGQGKPMNDEYLNGGSGEKIKRESSSLRRLRPLPFYNQITKDDFKTITTTTPNGTTITTLVPTDQAMDQARSNAANMNKPLEINGIPLAMLEATGSVRDNLIKNLDVTQDSPDETMPSQPSRFSQGFSQNPVQTANSQMPAQSEPGQIPLTSHYDNPHDPNASLQYMERTQYGGVADQMDTFFQQQSHGWLNNDNYQDDDFLGWFDVNMIPEK